jgi:hypothetical protein
LAQEAYSTCLSAGNSESECLPAYRTYLGDPNASAPATQANQNGICPAGYVADDSASSGCSRVSPLGGGANSSTSGIHDYNSCVLAGGEQDTCRQSYPTFETQAGEDAYQLMRNSNPNAQDQINCQDSGGTPVVDADRQYVRCDMGNGDTSAPVLIQDTTPSPSAGSDSCQQDPHAWFCPGNDIPSTE